MAFTAPIINNTLLGTQPVRPWHPPLKAWHPPMAVPGQAAQAPFSMDDVMQLGPKTQPQAPITSTRQAPAAQRPADNTPAIKTQGQLTSQAAMEGMRAGSQVPASDDILSNIAAPLASGAQGALMGASVAGPAGAVAGGVTGLVIGGINAWIGNRATRKERDRQNALEAEYRKLNEEAIARDEKWREVNQANILNDRDYNRNRYSMEAAWNKNQEFGKNMMQMINANSALKDKFAKQGYV